MTVFLRQVIDVLDTATDTLVKSIDTTATGTDAHGMAVVGGRYIWMGNRGEGDNIVVLDSATDEVVGTFAGLSIGPDIMEASPGNDRVFISLRGPNNLTGGAPARGATPGLAVLAVRENGRSGAAGFFVPIGDQSPTSPVDPHALAVRHMAGPATAPLPPAPAAGPAPAPVVPAAPAPAQAPRALPRTGEATGLGGSASAGIVLLLLGLALRRRS